MQSLESVRGSRHFKKGLDRYGLFYLGRLIRVFSDPQEAHKEIIRLVSKEHPAYGDFFYWDYSVISLMNEEEEFVRAIPDVELELEVDCRSNREVDQEVDRRSNQEVDRRSNQEVDRRSKVECFFHPTTGQRIETVENQEVDRRSKVECFFHPTTGQRIEAVENQEVDRNEETQVGDNWEIK